MHLVPLNRVCSYDGNCMFFLCFPQLQKEENRSEQKPVGNEQSTALTAGLKSEVFFPSSVGVLCKAEEWQHYQ